MPKIENDAVSQPRRGRPRDPERYQRILEAARSHFCAHGLERASVDAIAADAGVSKMTVYSHFASKEGLFEAVIRERTERVMGGLAGVEALDPKQPQKALLAIGEQFLTLAREEDALGQFRSVYGAAGAQPEACQAFYRQGANRLINDLAAYLRRADAAGTLKVRDPRQAADPSSGACRRQARTAPTRPSVLRRPPRRHRRKSPCDPRCRRGLARSDDDQV